MASQTVLTNGAAQQHPTLAPPTIQVPLDFNLQAVDARLLQIKPADSIVEGIVHKLNQPVVTQELKNAVETPAQRDARLGCLTGFQGTFEGPGFNMIFRPKSNKPMDTTFTTPVNTHGSPDDNVLEMNLTRETLQFTDTLGAIPNRGLDDQPDINLSGVSYVQTVFDVTNVHTGKGDATPKPIHFEPGIWVLTPATVQPPSPPMLARMGSIPHGTTIHAQGPAAGPQDTISTAASIGVVNLTPFNGDDPNSRFGFSSTTVTNNDTRRLPQNLDLFVKAGTITQQILDDPNTVLRNANVGKKITKTTTFKVSAGTDSIANINMLGPNAKATKLESTFFVQTVEYQVEVKKGATKGTVLSPKNMPKNGEAPKFVIANTQPIAADKTVTRSTTQIQSSQTVVLFFNTLSWPHVSVSTLIPKDPIPIII